MKTDTKTKRLGICALENINCDLSCEKMARLLIINVGPEAAKLTAELKVLCGHKEVLSPDELDKVMNSGYPLSQRYLAVGGEDIKPLGFVGKEIGNALSELLLMTARDEVKNEREALLSALIKIKNGF